MRPRSGIIGAGKIAMCKLTYVYVLASLYSGSSHAAQRNVVPVVAPRHSDLAEFLSRVFAHRAGDRRVSGYRAIALRRIDQFPVLQFFSCQATVYVPGRRSA